MARTLRRSTRRIVRCSAIGGKDYSGMKYWLIGVTAVLSLMAMAPDYSVTTAGVREPSFSMKDKFTNMDFVDIFHGRLYRCQ